VTALPGTVAVSTERGRWAAGSSVSSERTHALDESNVSSCQTGTPSPSMDAMDAKGKKVNRA
jgi:hypothetical protein